MNDSGDIAVVEAAKEKLKGAAPLAVIQDQKPLWQFLLDSEMDRPTNNPELVYTAKKAYPDVVRYTGRLGRLVEINLSLHPTKDFDDVVTNALFEAGPNLDDTTNFVRVGLSILIACWKRGEQLRKWADNSRFNDHPGKPGVWLVPVSHILLRSNPECD
jgi:hypothetical protein